MQTHEIVIPCRLNSTRLPKKLLLEVDKKPVLWYTYQTCLKTGLLTTVITDSREIAQYCQSEAIPVELDMQPAVNGTERIYNAHKLHTYSYRNTCYINVQGDHPVFDISLVKLMAKKYRPSTIITGYYNGHQLDCDNPSKVKMVMRGQDITYFSRSNIPYGTKTPKIHVGIYKYGSWVPQRNGMDYAEENLEQLQWNFSGAFWAFETKPPMSIDTQADLDLFRNLISQYGYEGLCNHLYS